MSRNSSLKRIEANHRNAQRIHRTSAAAKAIPRTLQPNQTKPTLTPGQATSKPKSKRFEDYPIFAPEPAC